MTRPLSIVNFERCYFGVLTAIGYLIPLALCYFAARRASVVAFVLNAVAVWLLFQPDARAWFGETVERGDVA